MEVSECGSTADFLATYHYFAELKLCIGGVSWEKLRKSVGVFAKVWSES